MKEGTIMNNISRRTFLALGCCAAGAAFCSPLVSTAKAAVLETAEVNRLFAELGAKKKAPAALDAWINDPAAQKIAPYQAFDNVWQVGIAWGFVLGHQNQRRVGAHRYHA